MTPKARREELVLRVAHALAWYESTQRSAMKPVMPERLYNSKEVSCKVRLLIDANHVIEAMNYAGLELSLVKKVKRP